MTDSIEKILSQSIPESLGSYIARQRGHADERLQDAEGDFIRRRTALREQLEIYRSPEGTTPCAQDVLVHAFWLMLESTTFMGRNANPFFPEERRDFSESEQYRIAEEMCQYLDRLAQPKLKRWTPLDKGREKQLIEDLEEFYETMAQSEHSAHESATDEKIDQALIRREQTRLFQQLTDNAAILPNAVRQFDIDRDLDFMLEQSIDAAGAWQVGLGKPDYLDHETFSKLIDSAVAMEAPVLETIQHARQLLADDVSTLDEETVDRCHDGFKKLKQQSNDAVTVYYEPSHAAREQLHAQAMQSMKGLGANMLALSTAIETMKAIQATHRGMNVQEP